MQHSGKLAVDLQIYPTEISHEVFDMCTILPLKSPLLAKATLAGINRYTNYCYAVVSHLVTYPFDFYNFFRVGRGKPIIGYPVD